MSVKNSSKDELHIAVRSILNQTYKNFEFIICNDNSTDDTLDRLENYQKLDDRIKIINTNTDNKGLAYALNLCISISKGEYIARMDADDVSYPDRLKIQVDFLKGNQSIDFCSSSIDLYDGEKVSLKNKKSISFPTMRDMVKGSPFVHPATMFRKKTLDELYGYRVSKETMRAEDYDLFMRAYAKGFKGANIQTNLFRYKLSYNDIKKKWTLKNRLMEVRVRYYGYKQMDVPITAYMYCLKPIIAWLIPANISYKLQTEKKTNN